MDEPQYLILILRIKNENIHYNRGTSILGILILESAKHVEIIPPKGKKYYAVDYYAG